MEDKETGIDPVATDGEPSADELERRRKARKGNGGSAKDRALAAEQAQLDGEDGVGEADDGQLFVWEQGTKVTLGTLIGRNVPVEHAFVFGGKRVPGRGGLMALDEQPILVVRGMAGPVRLVPSHDEHGKVTKVVIEQSVGAVVVHPADSDEAEAMVAPIFAARAARKKASG
jgi:hypothetical protein